MNTTSRHLLDEVAATIGKRKMFLTTGEFAQITGMHRQTVWGMCARGELPAKQNAARGPWFIHYSALTNFIKEQAA